eukprot:13765848-Alexandrium_andersonii.AAC.1
MRGAWSYLRGPDPANLLRGKRFVRNGAPLLSSRACAVRFPTRGAASSSGALRAATPSRGGAAARSEACPRRRALSW